LIRSGVATYLNKLFSDVVSAENGLEALEYYKRGDYDIVITDIQMPQMDGLEMLAQIKRINPEQETIVVSAYSDASYFTDAIRLQVSGYIIKPINFIQLNETLYRSLTRLVMIKENREYKENLEEMVARRTRENLRLETEKYENFEQTLQSLVQMIEGRDTYTGGHSQRVAEYSRLIAKEMGLQAAECDLIYRAGILHDIGKIATPDMILLKPGKLTYLEYELIQEHVKVGYELLNGIPMYNAMAQIIRYHHEHYDGTGYPEGLAGDEIPLLSHIMIVADAFDAMTTNRIYKARMNVEEALSEVWRLEGVQFHPEVVNAAMRALVNVRPPESVTQLPKSQTEQARFAYYYRDQLSGAYNRDYLNYILTANSFSREFHCINVIYLSHFGQYNQRYGWHEGDALLERFADHLLASYPQSLLFRIYGDDFVLVSHDCLKIDAQAMEALPWLEESGIGIGARYFDLHEVHIDSFEELEEALKGRGH
jgi:putative nucleotidyltransferase with HDIG domain